MLLAVNDYLQHVRARAVHPAGFLVLYVIKKGGQSKWKNVCA